MKKLNNILSISALMAMALFAGCTQSEQNLPIEKEENNLFIAKMEGFSDSDDTKTMMGGAAGDAHRDILWLPSDSISITVDGSTIHKFVNVNNENSGTGSFSGTIAAAENYYAIYPCNSKKVSFSTESFFFEIPSIQKYVAGNVASDMFPMVAKTQGTTIEFNNLCGILVLYLKGTGRVKSISFTGYDVNGESIKVSGAASVKMDYAQDKKPSITMLSDALDYVTLDCGEGVEISADKATPFYFVLPPKTFPTFTLSVKMADGKVMNKNATKPLTVIRSNRVPTADLTYAEDQIIDLCSAGTSNCYIAPAAGKYSLNGTVIGNGASGIIAGANFHTEDASIAPLSAGLLWEDVEGLISEVSLSADGKITFNASTARGNGVIAAYSQAECKGDILWSWHIWCSMMPEIENYSNRVLRKYDMMDRNLGAISNKPYNKNENTFGLYYQWGRKDPFRLKNATEAKSSSTGTIEYSVKNPDKFIAVNTSYYDWLYLMNDYLWGNPTGYNYTAVLIKTIYDPCPVGYMVPPYDTWTQFSFNNQINAVGPASTGKSLFYSDFHIGKYTWYPASGCIDYSGECVYQNNYGNYLSSSPYSSSNSNFSSGLEISSSSLEYMSNLLRSNGSSIRCMKEISSLPPKGATVVVITYSESVKNDRLTIESNVSDRGDSDVTARGICWKKGGYPTIELDSKTVDGTGIGGYSSIATGLEDGTQYWIRAYVTNSAGTNYSFPYSVTTTSRPSVFTNSVSDVKATSATALGNITKQGTNSVTSRGFCWSTSENPTISDTKSQDGTGTGLYSTNITNLTPSTTYYLRAYATNSEGTSYGEQKIFTTLAQ